MDKYAQQALAEYNSEANMIRPGGINGNPFWNVNAMKFTYIPSFQFPSITPSTAAERYEFTATDCTGKVHTFIADRPTAPLTPIWKDLAPGVVELKVEAVLKYSPEKYIMGVRTFFKSSPFPGRSALPPRARSYKETAIRAFEYTFNDSASQYWLKYGKPDPEYYHNVYPSKMVSAIVRAMLTYAELVPEMADQALKLATNAADYLLSITYGEDTGVAGLTPTICFDGLNRETVNATAPAAEGRKNMVMLIYPATAGSMYIMLEKATGDEKYLKAAQDIANYYKNNVLPNGSWPLMVSVTDNQPLCDNCCSTFDILRFLNAFYKRTGEECWNLLEKNYFAYIMENHCKPFNWEAQFEDSAISSLYSNLTHYNAGNLIDYITEEMPDNAEMMEIAKEHLRFVEDQFVTWGKFAPWSSFYTEGKSCWFSPAGMEQYHWLVPIDASTGALMVNFLSLYKVTKDELLLEKACALGDSITRRQNVESGVIPTHWMKEDCAENLENFWINCNISSATSLLKLAKITGELD